MADGAARLAQGVLSAADVDDGYRAEVAEPLEVLLQALLDEPDLPTAAFDRVLQRCRDDVARVANAQDDRRIYPEIAEVEVARPLFILGMPRCGTSILQALLGADPSAQMLRQWEWAHYSPPPAPAGPDDPHIAAMERTLEATGPMRVMHPIGAMQPQECGGILELSFRSTMFCMDVRVAPYLEWYLQSDATPAYTLHREWLQHFQVRRDPSHWVLKVQEHMYHAPELLRVYPNAMLVQPHRDPTTVIASISSLIATLRQRLFPDVDPIALGREMLHLWGSGLERFMAFRAANPQVRVCDVAYSDIVADPVGTAAGIHAYFELDWTDDTSSAVAAWWRENPPNKAGVHRYSLSDWGLADSEVEAYYADYRDAYRDWL